MPMRSTPCASLPMVITPEPWVADLGNAYLYFFSASAANDLPGDNGLATSTSGGTRRSLVIYLTGNVTDQSLQKAVLWYTQSLDLGRTSAAYSLSVMLLNGNLAAQLLKKVCERGEWASSKFVVFNGAADADGLRGYRGNT